MRGRRPKRAPAPFSQARGRRVATIRIGGKDIELPEIKLRIMRMMLPKIGALQVTALSAETGDEVDAIIGQTLEVLALWLDPPPRGESPELAAERMAKKVAELEDEMSAIEAKGLGPSIQAALKAR